MDFLLGFFSGPWRLPTQRSASSLTCLLLARELLPHAAAQVEPAHTSAGTWASSWPGPKTSTGSLSTEQILFCCDVTDMLGKLQQRGTSYL